MELKNVAEQALISLIQTATETMAFLKGEIPLAVKELLAYYTAVYVAYILIGFLFSAIGLFGFYKIRSTKTLSRFPEKSSYAGDQGDVKSFSWFLLIISNLVGFLVFIHWIDNLLKITIAPRIWLIEYAAGLVK